MAPREDLPRLGVGLLTALAAVAQSGFDDPTFAEAALTAGVEALQPAATGSDFESAWESPLPHVGNFAAVDTDGDGELDVELDPATGEPVQSD